MNLETGWGSVVESSIRDSPGKPRIAVVPDLGRIYVVLLASLGSLRVNLEAMDQPAAEITSHSTWGTGAFSCFPSGQIQGILLSLNGPELVTLVIFAALLK